MGFIAETLSPIASAEANVSTQDRSPFFGPLAVLGFVAGILYLFWPTVLSGFAHLPGDLGDFRFINSVLEHWYLALRGQESWRDLGFFFPQPGVLGYSDAHFLHSLPYIVFRAGGLSPYYAHFCTLIVQLGVAYGAMLWLLHRVLRVAWPIALVVAIMFAFSNFNALKVIHPHFYASGLVPLAIGLAWCFVKELARGGRIGTYGAGLAVLLPMVLFTSYYVGWFTLVLFGLWGAVLFIQQWLSAPARLRVFFGRICAARYQLALLAAVFLVALTPFLVTYVSVFRDLGVRPWQDVASMLPTAVDFVNVSSSNIMWGWLVAAIVPDTGPMSHELVLGFGPLFLALFLATLGWLVMRTPLVKAGTAAGPVTDQALICLGVAVILAWIMMLKVGDQSLWSHVFVWFPGAGAIRAVFRFQLVLQVAAYMVIACVLSRAWHHRKRLPLIGVLLALLLVEQLNSFRPVYDAKRENDWLRSVQPPLAACGYFLVEPRSAHPDRVWVDVQTDAIMISQRTGIPTINGYSSSLPSGWNDVLLHVGSPHYARDAVSWLRQNSLREGLCMFNLTTRTWWIPKPDGRDLRGLNLVRYDVRSIEDGLVFDLRGFHGLEPEGRWTNGAAVIIPAFPMPAKRVVINGIVGDPQGSRIRIEIDGLPRWEQTIRGGPFRVEIPVADSVTRIEIASTTFVPKLIGMNEDSRQLGVMIDNVTID